MNSEARKRVVELIKNHANALSDNKICESYLKDYLAEYRPEMAALLTAINEDVPRQLKAAAAKGTAGILVNKLAKTLAEQSALAPEAARWAVETWAISLGIVVSVAPAAQVASPPSSAAPKGASQSAAKGTAVASSAPNRPTGQNAPAVGIPPASPPPPSAPWSPPQPDPDEASWPPERRQAAADFRAGLTRIMNDQVERGLVQVQQAMAFDWTYAVRALRDPYLRKHLPALSTIVVELLAKRTRDNIPKGVNLASALGAAAADLAVDAKYDVAVSTLRATVVCDPSEAISAIKNPSFGRCLSDVARTIAEADAISREPSFGTALFDAACLLAASNIDAAFSALSAAIANNASHALAAVRSPAFSSRLETLAKRLADTRTKTGAGLSVDAKKARDDELGKALFEAATRLGKNGEVDTALRTLDDACACDWSYATAALRDPAFAGFLDRLCVHVAKLRSQRLASGGSLPDKNSLGKAFLDAARSLVGIGMLQESFSAVAVAAECDWGLAIAALQAPEFTSEVFRLAKDVFQRREDLKKKAPATVAEFDRLLGAAFFGVARTLVSSHQVAPALEIIAFAIECDIVYATSALGDNAFYPIFKQLDGYLENIRKARAASIKSAISTDIKNIRKEAFSRPELSTSPVLKAWQTTLREIDAWDLARVLECYVAMPKDKALLLNSLLAARIYVTETRTVEVLEKKIIRPWKWWLFWLSEISEPIKVNKRMTKTFALNGLGNEYKMTDGFVEIKPGDFQMGSPDSERRPLIKRYSTDRFTNEIEHRVVISRPFALGETPVTQAVWQALMGSNPSGHKGDRLPVENVTWFDAIQFCNALSTAMGLDPAYVISGKDVSWKGISHPGFRLPTEAEWEYACRAGTMGPHYGKREDVAWLETNSGRTSHPVGEKKPNAWGLYDMLGNVWEWCWDWYAVVSREKAVDPVGPSSGSARVRRGSSWSNGYAATRAACRRSNEPTYRENVLGLRVARTLEP